MYIPELVVGFALGLFSTIATLFVIGIIYMKKNKKENEE